MEGKLMKNLPIIAIIALTFGTAGLTMGSDALAAGGATAEDHGGHGGHHYFTGDDDHDGTPNWRDSMNGDQPNNAPNATENPGTYIPMMLAFHAFNLTLLFAIFFMFARKPLQAALRARALHIRKDLDDSAQARVKAQEDYDKLMGRLNSIESEMAQMTADAHAAAANEEAKLAERAQREGARIAETAQRAIRDETGRAQTALRQDAVALAVSLAEGVLTKNINHDDQQVLAREFLQSLDGTLMGTKGEEADA